ncbi:ecto-ADP-ribosyltransferase 4 [Dasypus novemcinctus]|uniref:ecto-ADP-ribosyltransferase 4 n=1 Tax=Dasypus novemcinctus TaxID=9361 RepID=UPI000328A5BA|nr:ecto-ADP-ribosyltransferase 4 [Dasypus novemcinctus]
MRLRGQGSSARSSTTRGPRAAGRRGPLLRSAAAPARRAWLLGPRLPLLLLLSGLHRPAQGSEVDIKIDFNLAPDSFDDQYRGCSKQVMEELNQGNYFTKEVQVHSNYSKAWQKAHLTWLNQARVLSKNMTTPHAVAILVYMLDNNMRSNFTSAMTSAGRSPQQYHHSFHFKYLHYYLTSALQLLREELLVKNGTVCYEVYHWAKDAYFEAYTGATIRFGQFLTTSLLREETQKLGNQTLFTIFTCLGAPVQEFSLKKEVLVPPYELFKVINVSHHPRGNWVQLQSTGNLSTYNCQLLKASSNKCIPASLVIASLFFTSVLISSKRI